MLLGAIEDYKKGYNVKTINVNCNNILNLKVIEFNYFQ